MHIAQPRLLLNASTFQKPPDATRFPALCYSLWPGPYLWPIPLAVFAVFVHWRVLRGLGTGQQSLDCSAPLKILVPLLWQSTFLPWEYLKLRREMSSFCSTENSFLPCASGYSEYNLEFQERMDTPPPLMETVYVWQGTRNKVGCGED